jgi:hypothetical protein
LELGFFEKAESWRVANIALGKVEKLDNPDGALE